MVSDVEEVHSQDFNSSNFTPFLEQLFHVGSDEVAIVEESDLFRVVAHVSEFATDSPNYIVGLSVDELVKILNVVDRRHWVVDNVVHDSRDVHRRSIGVRN